MSVCLVQMGKSGLELIKAYPDVLPQPLKNEITIKSMPLGAKAGDFTSNVMNNGSAISGYVFIIPSQTERNNIASLVAVFDNSDYNIQSVRKLFSIIISELQNNDAISLKLLQQILPSIYNAFGSKTIKIKISSVTTIEVKIEDDKDKAESNGKRVAKSFAEDLW